MPASCSRLLSISLDILFASPNKRSLLQAEAKHHAGYILLSTIPFGCSDFSKSSVSPTSGASTRFPTIILMATFLHINHKLRFSISLLSKFTLLGARRISVVVIH